MADTDTALRLTRLGTAALADAMDGRNIAGPALRPLWRPLVVAGLAFTVAGPPADNRPLHRAVAAAPPGSIIVAAVGGDAGAAIFGDVLGRVCRGRGVAGLVTDGAVRDSDGLRAAGFPVVCAGLSLRAPAKVAVGELGGEVELAGLRVRAGDWLVADGDGVVAVPTGELAEVLAAAEAIEAREAELVRTALAGRSTAAQLGIE